MNNTQKIPSANFIRTIIEQDLKSEKHQEIITRFPPEPNGFLHIGHAKSICLNFGLAKDYHGKCHLRFDDTNPAKENQGYIESIKEAVQWMGFQWDQLTYASDYFQELYHYAEKLIQLGKAYVCSLTADEIRQYRGTLTEPGQESPYRQRSIAENLDLFQRMRQGEFQEGEHVLRAKINMTSPNINLRDPVIYRIRYVNHHHTDDQWCIYPIYDFTHCISDAIEGITHSICTLEFEDHRPLYNWYLQQVWDHEITPRQIEFSRLDLSYTVTSKRKLNELVTGEYVNGWDDPRMPTIIGMRRRGYPAAALRDFCERVGVTKKDNCVEFSYLETCVREALENSARRVMVVLKPLKLIITNYPQEQEEILTAPYHPNQPNLGTRQIPFAREIYIEQDDFNENPPPKYFRLTPGAEVRLRYAYIIRCEKVIKDPQTNEIIEVHCTYDPQTKSGSPQSNRKVKGTLHWVPVAHSLSVKINLYDRLFTVENPSANKEVDFKTYLNSNSLETLTLSKAEPSLGNVQPENHFQFERQGYFFVDQESTPDSIIFNRTVTLRDSWGKIQKKNSA